MLFAGCSKTPSAADWGAHGLVAMGSGANSIVLWQPQDSNVVPTALQGHTARVNAVRWSNPSVLVSGSADHSVGVWLRADGDTAPSHTCSQLLKGHTGSVEAVTALSSGSSLLIASAGADGTVRIWEGEPGDVEHVQTISFGNKYPLSVALCPLFETSLNLLAIGVVDSNVHLYVQRSSSKQFELAVVLKGHEDWVRSVAFARFSDSEICLASASQDKYARLWQLQPSTSAAMSQASKQSTTIEDLLQALEESGLAMKAKASYFSVGDPEQVFSIVLDALLIGHEDWVYSVAFPPLIAGERFHERKVLTASMDKTMILWTPHENTNTWFSDVRVGDVGGQNILGFYGGLFGPGATSILAHGFNGALQRYVSDGKDWRPVPTPSGHYAAVNDIAWDPLGRYLVSVSDDRTARLWGPYSASSSWHELARPQVHGYELQCIAFTTLHEYISGGDEKVVRLFDAPTSFFKSLEALSGQPLVQADHDAAARIGAIQSASTPALGLSNKAVLSGGATASEDGDEDGPVDMSKSLVTAPTPSSLFLSSPPLEEQLVQSLLWAETDKLYGHPYEIFAVACDHNGRTAVSSCKATQATHALIRVWAFERTAATTSGAASVVKQVGTLPQSHTLTVTHMRFSYDDLWLLSVSRDRSFSLYKRSAPGTLDFALVHHNEKAHTRIIWACAFTPDNLFFATCSRDKTVKIWSLDKAAKLVSSLDFEDNVTAIDIAPKLLDDGRYIAVVGLENGSLIALTGGGASSNWSVHSRVPKPLSHTAAVQRTVFRPDHPWQFASAGADHHVRINSLSLSLNNL